MTSPSDAMNEPAKTPTPSGPLRPTRPFYWSVRREIWENRSFYLAPLAVAGLVLTGFIISTWGLAHRRLLTLAMRPDQQTAVISQPFDFAGAAVMITIYIVAVVYCLGALHGERRDRSVLFWKSLPVSDRTTVLAKMFAPMAVLPVTAAAILLVLQLVMWAWSTVALLANGMAPATAAQLPLGDIIAVQDYALITTTLWFAPIYAWFLMVAAWAKRVPFLWAVLPPAALCLAEKLAFNTTYLTKLMGDRFVGGYTHAFVSHPQVERTTELREVSSEQAFGEATRQATAQAAHTGHAAHAAPQMHTVGVADIDLGKFLSTPGLWIGLLVAATFVAAAIWLRRRREPL